MFAGTALSVRLLVYAGLSLFIIYGPYLYVVVCVFYAYNLTVSQPKTGRAGLDCQGESGDLATVINCVRIGTITLALVKILPRGQDLLTNPKAKVICP